MWHSCRSQRASVLQRLAWAAVLQRLAWAASAVRFVFKSMALASIFACPGLVNNFTANTKTPIFLCLCLLSHCLNGQPKPSMAYQGNFPPYYKPDLSHCSLYRWTRKLTENSDNKGWWSSQWKHHKKKWTQLWKLLFIYFLISSICDLLWWTNHLKM